MPKFKGIPVTLGDKTFIVPPLSFRALKEHQDALASYAGQMDTASLTLVETVAKAALLRNYTEKEVEELEDLLDVGNMEEVMTAVMDVSGLRRKAYEASQQQGGADPSTGTNSTGS